MKTQLILAAALLCILSSCSEDEIHIGDRFLLYKSEESPRRFDSIGLDVGGTQRLIRGKRPHGGGLGTARPTLHTRRAWSHAHSRNNSH